MTDADGDQAEDTHNIEVTDGADPISEGTELLVDESAITDSDNTPALSFTAGSDDLVGFAFSDDLSGLDIDVSDDTTPDVFWFRADDTTIQGYVNGDNTSGTLAITLALTDPGTITAGNTSDVTVTATLTDAFPHPDAGGAQTVSVGSVNVVATDTDGSETEASVAVSVLDDVPTVDLVPDTTDPDRYR